MGSRQTKAVTTTTDPTSTVAATGQRNKRTAAADQAQISELERLRFEAIRNGRYHLARRGWYEWLHRLMMFAVVMGGAGVVIQAVGDGFGLLLLAFIPTTAGTLDLVFDYGGKASHHARLQERSYAVLADVEECNDEPAAVCRRGWAALARMYAEEMKTMRAVDALAYNDTKEATEDEADGELLVVPWYARRLRHLCAFDGLKLPRMKDVKRAP